MAYLTGLLILLLTLLPLLIPAVITGFHGIADLAKAR